MNAVAIYSKNSNYLFIFEELLNKCKAIWNKISGLFKKEFDSKPVYKDKYIRPKVNWYNTPLSW